MVIYCYENGNFCKNLINIQCFTISRRNFIKPKYMLGAGLFGVCFPAKWIEFRYCRDANNVKSVYKNKNAEKNLLFVLIEQM